ncbi:MAG TPA: TonB-dependent receptor, partial [Polyangiales bacterium]|nr:TonB-dependent receptor [Polyangiales bacterium]
MDKPWARRLVLRTFFSDHQKELQHGTVLTVPYGDEESRRNLAGASARYLNTFRDSVRVDALAGYTLARIQLWDPDRCVYDWWGKCILQNAFPIRRDLLTEQRTAFARANLEWQASPMSTLRLAIAPTFQTVVSDERAKEDPNDGDRRTLFTTVVGLEHQLSILDRRLENIAFAKGYLQTVRAEKHVGEISLNRDRNTLQPGIGNALRLRVLPSAYAKASYEYATRLPNLEEIFGDGVLIQPNLELVPETSHNLNFGATLDLSESKTGSWYLEVNGFLRETKNQIVAGPPSQQGIFSQVNALGSRSLGVEATGSWT